MEPTPAPISAELWARLRALDPRVAEIAMIRTAPQKRSPWADCHRVWVVTIRRGLYESAQAVHPFLAESLREAVEEAERRGWNRPHGSAGATAA